VEGSPVSGRRDEMNFKERVRREKQMEDEMRMRFIFELRRMVSRRTQ